MSADGAGVPDLDRADLTPVVRAALDEPAAEPLAWSVAPIAYANVRPGTHTVFRVAGSARVGDGTRDWSAVVKPIRRPVRDGEPAPLACGPHGHCWVREVLAYRAGLLDDLPGVRAPRCHALVERPDGFWLWMEALAEATGRAWPVARFALAARHFGRFGGAYLTGRPLPEHPWLSRARLGPTGRLTGTPGWALDLAGRDETWAHPLVRRAHPPAVAARVRRLAAEHDRLYQQLRALPRVLCHWDAYRPNLFSVRAADGTDETVAIDWSCMGHGAVGEELVPLVVVSLLWFEAPAAEARRLAEACLDAYLAGLGDAGWTGDPALVRRAFASSLVRWLPLGAGLHLLTRPDPAGYAAQVWGRDLDEAVDQWSASTAALLPIAEQAAH